MRIAGKIHDYYDGALKLGRDENLFFHRIEQEGDVRIALNLLDKLNNSVKDDHGFYHRYSLRGGSDYLDFEIIGFCGKLYPLVRLTYHTAGTIEDPLGIYYDDCFYGTDGLTKLDELLQSPQLEAVLNRYMSVERRWKKVSNRDILLQYMKAIQESPVCDNIFIDARTPYFRVQFNHNHDVVTYCPTLKDSQFYKVKDAFTAFQEISMYIGGVIPRQMPELITISDKDRVNQHGFDKYSFRHRA